jgi:ectoine hydroxylase-related dioxygenase (phytanoyl-CoA dioxygenase family)
MITQQQIDFFNENGFLRVEQVFPPAELAQMSSDLDDIITTHADWGAAWKGEWRKEYMEEEEDKKAVLVAIHELHHYSGSWTRGLTKLDFAEAVGGLLGSDCVEIHHSTLHAKAPGTGMPFHMHQDVPFYPHTDGRYVDALVHLDDATEENGCIKFLAGSHKLGPLDHISGPEVTPHLPTDQYRLADAVSVPAKAGDVVFFHLWTVHGSNVNRTPHWRRLVRVGFRDPRNRQVGGQAMGRPGVIVLGTRPKVEALEVNVYGNWAVPA